jgi:hypothetical protein
MLHVPLELDSAVIIEYQHLFSESACNPVVFSHVTNFNIANMH